MVENTILIGFYLGLLLLVAFSFGVFLDFLIKKQTTEKIRKEVSLKQLVESAKRIHSLCKESAEASNITEISCVIEGQPCPFRSKQGCRISEAPNEWNFPTILRST